MSKKFSILKSIDTDKLDKQIDNYECETGEVPYLFMTRATGDAMLKELCDIPILRPTEIDEMLKMMTPGVKIGSYKGCKIYENEDLAFGEVEIR